MQSPYSLRQDSTSTVVKNPHKTARRAIMQTAVGIGVRGGFIFGNGVRSCSEGLQKSGGAGWKRCRSQGDDSSAFPVQARGDRGQSRALPFPAPRWAEGGTAPPPRSAPQVRALNKVKNQQQNIPNPFTPGQRGTAAVRRERVSRGEYGGGRRPEGGCPTHGGSRAGAEPREEKGRFEEQEKPWLGC